MNFTCPTVAKIYTENFRHNIREIKALLKPGVKMCIAVKADAYGHGALECSEIAVSENVDFLAVARVNEGIELRRGGIKIPILLLSLCPPEEFDLLVEYNITPFVFDEEYISGIAGAVKKSGKEKFAVHLAVDTGMGRIGCLPSEALKNAQFIENTGFLKLGGIGTHCAVADSFKKSDRKYTKKQFDAFCAAVKEIKDAGIDTGICHFSNSAAGIDNPEMQLDMVRPGISVYGYYPGTLSRKYFKKKNIKFDLKPVMALCTKVSAVRKFARGKSVSYGRTWHAKKNTEIAVLPAGYGDGVFRKFSCKKIKIAVNGKPYSICGRICMDQFMIDVGENSAVRRWDEAVIFGPEESGAFVTAEDIARAVGTIPYEITCGISKRVIRIYI